MLHPQSSLTSCFCRKITKPIRPSLTLFVLQEVCDGDNCNASADSEEDSKSSAARVAIAGTASLLIVLFV